MSDSEYRKVFVASGWDAKSQSNFYLVGLSYSTDALKVFSKDQIKSFNIKIIHSKNFMEGNEGEYRDKVNGLFSNCEQKVVSSSISFKYNKIYYIDNLDATRIIKHLNAIMSHKEKEMKEIAKEKLK